MPRYARQIYDGLWFAPERIMIQAAMNAPSHMVSGNITLRLQRGLIIIEERSSKDTLYDVQLSSIEEDRDWKHSNASGYINLAAIRLKARPAKTSNVLSNGA